MRRICQTDLHSHKVRNNHEKSGEFDTFDAGNDTAADNKVAAAMAGFLRVKSSDVEVCDLPTVKLYFCEKDAGVGSSDVTVESLDDWRRLVAASAPEQSTHTVSLRQLRPETCKKTQLSVAFKSTVTSTNGTIQSTLQYTAAM